MSEPLVLTQDSRSRWEAPGEVRRDALLPLLVLLAGSGCAALIYEVVWLQLLQLVIGSSAVSLGLLLAAYMGGLCLGSMALPWPVPRSAHPLRVYAFLALGIAVFGVLLLFGVPFFPQLWHGMIAAACLSL